MPPMIRGLQGRLRRMDRRRRWVSASRAVRNRLSGFRRLDRCRRWALVSFLAGLVFLVGLFIQFFYFQKLYWTFPLEQLGKITVQSNLLALFTSGLYLFRPRHRFFRRNLLMVFATTLLCFAGIGFWCLLFPLYYIDLGPLIISSDTPQDASAAFYALWDHTVTQFFFLFFFRQINRSGDLNILVPEPTRKIIRHISVYTFSWIAYNAFSSFLLNIFPTYGILTNFNPNTTFMSKDTNVMLFDVRFLIISHILCFSLACTTSWYFSLWSIRLRAMTEYTVLRRARSMGYIN